MTDPRDDEYRSDARKTEGHPLVVLAAGGFLGGMIAGGNTAGFVVFCLLSLSGAFAAMVVFGHWQQIRKHGDQFLGSLLGISTIIPLPAGVLGYVAGKAFWG
ncbi:putative membrane protein YeaQ/YmgE (transglycosylase-associated protein family) [Variovorax boronicumulans]|uniref:hypothetical protein n=1 Tax=Variovorax boronicumulans TaxID=436515 RepID=UPI00277DD4A0|nr:hypothetical protein [Variovorax boronicumulans]MDP9996475.1 putative membrane protein YeaQ/YmgE (transglycosylase-associated protein family) [Variovorax boronicumulans]MDQ0007767.1 putative membrane protein YeaQ/YmgE (transglycosylase-associated protein family) [Variovorax boronicumulans]